MSSDSDDCQLYTRAAQNVEMKRRKLEDRPTLDEFEKIDELSSDNEIRNEVDKHIDLGLPSSSVVQTESDDDIPLSVLYEKLCNNKENSHSTSRGIGPKNTRKGGRKRRRISPITRTNGRDIAVVVFDDDSGYPAITTPIDFNSRSKQRSSLINVNDSIDDTSLNGILTQTYDEDDYDDNDVVTISVEWHNGQKLSREEFKLRKYQKLETVFEQLAKKEGLPSTYILLMHNFNSICPSDTPSSLNFNFYGALTGSVSKTEINHDKSRLDPSDGAVEDVKGGIKVKLQLQSQQTLTVCVMNNQKLGVLYKKCSEELGLDEGKIKITFDGELVEACDLVSDLDVEDGDIFNVYVKS